MKRGILLALMVGLLAFPVLAENAGDVAIQTVNQTIFTKAIAGSRVVVRNIGQSAHWLTYCADVGVTNLQIDLEGSNDSGGHWIPISSTLGTAINGSCGLLQAGGYFKDVSVNLITMTTTPPAGVSAWYSATAGPIAINPTGVFQSAVHQVLNGSATSVFVFTTLTGAIPQACTFTLDTQATALTTLNVYIQDSPDAGIAFNDRISFTQVASATDEQQVASITSSGSAGLVPTATSDGTLTAGTIRGPGPLQSYIQVKAVYTGATLLSFNVYAQCH